MILHKPIPQEEPMGCGVACVASLLGISYRESLNLFNRKHANVPNFYCKEIVNILKNRKLNYRYNKVTKKTEQHIHKIGSIVFIRKSEKYFYGHFLLKTKRGFMDSWINIPKMNPAKSGFRKKLPGKPQWIIYSNSNL